MTNPSQWAYDLLATKCFCILDTETTGLGNRDEICQIAILHGSGEPLLDCLVKPSVAISAEAEAIHGISNERVKNAPTLDVLLPAILRAVSDRDLVIFNAEFDLRLIRQTMRSLGIQLAFPTSDRRKGRIFLNGGLIHCAMEKYSEFVGDWSEYHQSYRWQKLPAGDHSALRDCRATLKVMQKMASTLADK